MLVQKKIAFLFVCIVFAFASCSFDNSDSSFGNLNGGSIYMLMPSANGKASGSPRASVSANVPSNGELFSSFKIFIKNSSLGKELTQTARPGDAVTFGDLAPGYWDVVVWGFGKSDSTTFYGASKNVLVAAGETSSASVSIRRTQEAVINLQLAESSDPDLPGRQSIFAAYVVYNCAALKKSGASYFMVDIGSQSQQPQNELELNIPLYDFLVPNVSCKAKVYLFDGDGSARWTADFDATVAGDGTLQGQAAFVEEPLTVNYPPAEPYLEVGGNAKQTLRDAEYTFDVGSSRISYDQLSAAAVADDYCGEIPVIVEYNGLAWAKAFTARHLSETPAVSVPDQTIPVGVTRKVVPTISPSEPKEWPLYECPANEQGNIMYDQYGFAKYGDFGNKDKDVWTSLGFSADGTPQNVILSDPDKFTAEESMGIDYYLYGLKVTMGAYGFFDTGDAESYKNVETRFTATGKLDWISTPATIEVEEGKSFSVTISSPSATATDYNSCLSSVSVMDNDGNSILEEKAVKSDGIELKLQLPSGWGAGSSYYPNFHIGSINPYISLDVTVVAPGGGSGGGGGGGSSGWHFDSSRGTYGADAANAYPLTKATGPSSLGTPCKFYLQHDGYETSTYNTTASTISEYLANPSLFASNPAIKVTVDGSELSTFSLSVSSESNAISLTISSTGNGDTPQEKVTSAAQSFAIKIVFFPGIASEESVEQTVWFVKQ